VSTTVQRTVREVLLEVRVVVGSRVEDGYHDLAASQSRVGLRRAIPSLPGLLPVKRPLLGERIVGRDEVSRRGDGLIRLRCVVVRFRSSMAASTWSSAVFTAPNARLSFVSLTVPYASTRVSASSGRTR
jgi:hypothetical protein